MHRRTFLKYLAGIGAYPVFGKGAAYAAGQQLKSAVTVSQHPGCLRADGSVSKDAVYEMLGHSLCRLIGTNSPAAALRQLFKTDERIGIKVNALGGTNICTHADLVYSLARHLTESGLHPENIIIWDRLTRELAGGGYRLQQGGQTVHCYGTDNRYEQELDFSGAIGSCFSTILTRHCDALINIPVLKDHDLSGVSLSLKNMYGAIHNPNKYHDNGCNPFVADVNAHPHIKNKLRLVVIDGLSGQYNGGPGYKPQWSWVFGGIIMSRDPVAADTIGAGIIDQKRLSQNLPTLAAAGRAPVHIRTAAQKGLGEGRLEHITTIRV